MITLIAAMDQNRGIGREGRLPWRLPGDLARFRRITTGHAVLMGRKTWESIGRPLPDRTNIVLSRRPAPADAQGVLWASTPEEGLKLAGEGEVFIIGGAEVFKLFLPRADRLLLTLIHQAFPADTFFPKVEEGQWELASVVPGMTDEDNPYSYDFREYLPIGR
ncbi:dihydrofolate reductase [Paenibacillus sp. YN15]|uniref:dihydrofolate reductase n=1 Tax=Paenibacillus sp. YN15 TaxID=1742774 RepID=UPI000DCB8D29|nr:dihydrofolate reductase [Paenibacillus sp. YN15]RAV04122.1 dihydrofolate reductase [Paenibacillus sp. YN15]